MASGRDLLTEEAKRLGLTGEDGVAIIEYQSDGESGQVGSRSGRSSALRRLLDVGLSLLGLQRRYRSSSQPQPRTGHTAQKEL